MLPAYTPDTSLCERFQEFHDRKHWVFYVPCTGSETEEAKAYGLLFEILRKQTAIMMLTPAEPERYEIQMDGHCAARPVHLDYHDPAPA